MDAATAVRDMVEASGMTHRQIEARAGRYGGWVGQSLARPKPGADLVSDIARACGYRLQLVPMDGGDAITIGDQGDATASASAATIDQARAMIARGLAMLDQMDG